MVASHLWFLFLLRAAGHAAVEPRYQTAPGRRLGHLRGACLGLRGFGLHCHVCSPGRRGRERPKGPGAIFPHLGCRTIRCEARTEGVQEPKAGAHSGPGQGQAPQHDSNLSPVTKLCVISFCGAIEMNRFSSSKHHGQSRYHCQF